METINNISLSLLTCVNAGCSKRRARYRQVGTQATPSDATPPSRMWYSTTLLPRQPEECSMRTGVRAILYGTLRCHMVWYGEV